MLVDVLGAPRNVRPDAVSLQLVPKEFRHLRHVGFPHGAASGQQPGNLAVFFLVQVAEGEILQLPLDFPDAEAMRQWGIDVQGLLGDAALFLGWECGEGPHVVEPVGQLDQDNADVLGHGHQHLAQAFGVEIVGVVGSVLQGADWVVDAAVKLG